MMLVRIVLFLVLSTVTASAGGRGGHSTTWSPNLFGGDWSCFTTLVAGCARAFGATCDGVTDDGPGITALLAYKNGSTPPFINVYVPPGSNCILNGGGGSLGVTKLRWWAYGATFNSIFNMGGNTYYDDNVHSARIQSASSEGCTVTLQSWEDPTIFSVGDWILTGQVSMSVNGSNPPTLYQSEPSLITNIVGSVFTINPCLHHNYLSTNPSTGEAFNGGPAQIWQLQPAWNTDVEFYGLTVLDGQAGIQAKVAYFLDVRWPLPIGDFQSPAPSGPGNIFMNFSYLDVPEFDKNITNLNINRSYLRHPLIQSAGINVTIENSAISVLDGSPDNLVLRNSTVDFAKIGPTSGPGGTWTLDGSTIAGLSCSNASAAASFFTFSNGTFSISKNANIFNRGDVYRTFVPGGTVYFGESDGTNDSSPHTQFTVTALRQSGPVNPNVTISNASPAVVGTTAHGLVAGDPLTFHLISPLGFYNLPSPLAINTTYYVLAAGLTANSFEVSLSPGGAAINTTTNGCCGTNPFSIVAGNTLIDTDIGNTLPTPTCNGHSCDYYVAYQVNTLVSKNSTAPGISTCVKP